ncbi:MarR family winged helix-turn-helix transcriptional regulator [Bacillus sp. CGMCC 1.16607]|uniref:MarR family winged helix-turn-helix transcriptional regulator n=1 Tax=Bacillus sp. CGMCC 1.16607 TaxID=3351842 RepID=UPI0036336738
MINILNNSHDLFHTLNQISRHVTNRVNDVLKPLGIYSSQWTVIFVLYSKGTMTQKELSEYLSIEAPPMTRTIQRLVANGFVKQIPGKDKREKYIQLTNEALVNYPKWEAAVTDLNHILLSSLPNHSQEELQKLLNGWLGKLS